MTKKEETPPVGRGNRIASPEPVPGRLLTFLKEEWF
jgi:hypothetical protein